MLLKLAGKVTIISAKRKITKGGEKEGLTIHCEKVKAAYKGKHKVLNIFAQNMIQLP